MQWGAIREVRARVQLAGCVWESSWWCVLSCLEAAVGPRNGAVKPWKVAAGVAGSMFGASERSNASISAEMSADSGSKVYRCVRRPASRGVDIRRSKCSCVDWAAVLEIVVFVSGTPPHHQLSELPVECVDGFVKLLLAMSSIVSVSLTGSLGVQGVRFARRSIDPLLQPNRTNHVRA